MTRITDAQVKELRRQLRDGSFLTVAVPQQREIAFNQQGGIMFKQISARDLAMRLENGHAITLLDVRQVEENEIAALPGSILIPLNELPARVDEVASLPEAAVVVYCHHGMRSQSGADFLDRAGVKEVYSLIGGIDAWSREVDPAVPRY